jgi:hypothetical protein
MTSHLQGQRTVEPMVGDVAVRLSRKKAGRMTNITLFTPIRRRWVPVQRAAMWVASFVPIVQRHTLQFDFIHYVRWSIVKELPYNGPPQERDRLNYPYTFIESNFDGPYQQYSEALSYMIPKDVRLVWGGGFEFAKVPPTEPLKRWFAKNNMEGGSYYSAYPEASTRMVLGALATRDALSGLTADWRRLDPEEFKTRYDEFLTELQGHL